MKHLLSALIVVSAVALAAPAMAHVVQATTSLSLTDVDVRDKPQLQQALKSAVDQVLKDVIAFKPTLVALTDAQVVGQRLYVRLLIADEEGEKTIDELNRGGEGGTGPDDEEQIPTKRAPRAVMWQ
jgi:hypothetical protein